MHISEYQVKLIKIEMFTSDKNFMLAYTLTVRYVYAFHLSPVRTSLISSVTHKKLHYLRNYYEYKNTISFVFYFAVFFVVCFVFQMFRVFLAVLFLPKPVGLFTFLFVSHLRSTCQNARMSQCFWLQVW